MNRFVFYKSLYETEISKITELNDSLNIPLAIIAIIGASLYTLSMNFIYKEFYTDSYFFIIFCALSVVNLLISIGYFINVFAFSFRSDYNYRYLEYADELEEIFMTLHGNNRILYFNEGNQSFLDFESFIIGRYVLYCGANARINRVKNTYLNKGKEFLVASLVFVIGAIVPFLINHFYHI